VAIALTPELTESLFASTIKGWKGLSSDNGNEVMMKILKVDRLLV
jgi:hypothetical protein